MVITKIDMVEVEYLDGSPSRIGTVFIPSYERMLWKALAEHEPREAEESVSSGKIAYALARHYNWPEEDVELSTWSGFLHDVGKRGIHLNVLNKPGSFTPKERIYMGLHVELSRILLDPFYPQFYAPLFHALEVPEPYPTLNEILYGLGIPSQIIDARDALARQRKDGEYLIQYNNGTVIAHTPSSLCAAQRAFIAGNHHMRDKYPYNVNDPLFNLERMSFDDAKPGGIPMRQHIVVIQLIQAIDGMLATKRPYREGAVPFQTVLSETEKIFANGDDPYLHTSEDTKKIVGLAAPSGYDLDGR